MNRFLSISSQSKACRFLHLAFLAISLFCSFDIYVYRVLASNLSTAQSVNALDSAAIGAIAQPSSEIAQATPLPVSQQQRVRVFFPKFPEAANDFTRVAAVQRSASGSSLARAAIAQLIAGPTAAEQRQGLRPALRLRGPSNCGQDFTIAITNGVATLRFCRPVVSAGVGEDARARSAIAATLQQFSSVRRIVILNAEGRCFADQSGEDRCL